MKIPKQPIAILVVAILLGAGIIRWDTRQPGFTLHKDSWLRKYQFTGEDHNSTMGFSGHLPRSFKI